MRYKTMDNTRQFWIGFRKHFRIAKCSYILIEMSVVYVVLIRVFDGEG